MAKGVVRQKKKKKNGCWALGGGRTTPKGMGVASATSYGQYKVTEATPRPLGVVRPPPKAQNPFFLSFFFFWPFEVAGPPPRA
jgi:hypothetical protein